MKFLSIVIPRYRETELELFPLLSSINNQVGVDFGTIEVLIANDGGGAGELNGDFLGLFRNLEIRQINLKENGGPGLARQAGIDAAQGQYLMFCDADDILHNVGVVGALTQEAERSAPDMLGSTWLEEVRTPEGQYQYVTHAHDNTWMHGKLLRRQYLVQNGIRHHPDLRVHEDSYLLAIAAALTDRISYLDITSYVWRFHEGSITRRDGAIYTYSSIPTFIYACCKADSVIEERAPHMMEPRILQFVLYCYFCFHQPNWLAPEHREHLEMAERAFAANIAPFRHYWTDAAPERIAEIYNQERARTFSGYVETETITEWTARIMGVK